MKQPSETSRDAARAAVYKRRETLLKALDTTIPDVPLPPLFMLGAILSAVVLVMSLLVYFVLIACLGWLTLECVWLTPRFWPAAVGVLIGAIVILVMLKPLVSLFRLKDNRVAVSPEEEPFLYDYVRQLSDLIGAPEPEAIRVCLEPNASAGFGNGVLGALGNKMELTIGLPLVAGLSVQQLSGIIAHELGHLSQRSGMRVMNLVSTLNYWYGQVVFGRDAADDWLERISGSGVFPLNIICSIAQGILSVVRRILWVLMLFGHTASTFTSRQAEFDADCFEAYVAGSRSFAAAFGRLFLLQAGAETAWSDLESAWNDRRLGDDFPALAVARARQIPKDRRKSIVKLCLHQKSHWADTHPSPASRIREVGKLRSPGVVRDPSSATVLFNSYRRVCRKVTLANYKTILSGAFDGAKVVSSEQFIKEQEATEKAEKSLARYYQGAFLIQQPVFPDPSGFAASESAQTALGNLKAARKEMVMAAPHMTDFVQRYDKNEMRRLQACHALALVRCGFSIDPSSFDLTVASADQIGATLNRLIGRRDALMVERTLFDGHAQTRLTAAFQLLRNQTVRKRLGTSADVLMQQVRVLLPLCPALERSGRHNEKVYESCCLLMGLLHSLQGHSDSQKLVQRILKQSDELASAIGQLRRSLERTRYPFPHAQESISAAQYLVPESPDPESPIESVRIGAEALTRYRSLLVRVLANLAVVAERVETAVGFETLKELEAPDELVVMLEEQLAKDQEPRSRWDAIISAVPWVWQIGSAVTLGLVLVGCLFGSIWAIGAFRRGELDRNSVRRAGETFQSVPASDLTRSLSAGRNPLSSRQTRPRARGDLSDRPSPMRTFRPPMPSGFRSPRTGPDPQPRIMENVNQAIAGLSQSEDEAKRNAILWLATADATDSGTRVALAIVRAYSDLPKDTKATALQLLGKWSDDKGVSALKEEQHAIHVFDWAEIVDYLEQVGSDEAIALLAERLEGSSSRDAKKSLIRIGSRSEETLWRHLDDHPTVVMAVYEILEAVGTDRSVAVLTERLHDHPDDDRCREVLRKIAPEKFDEVGEAIFNLQLGDTAKRLAATRRIARLKDDSRLKELVPLLISRLNEADDEEQLALIEALGVIGGETAVDAVVRLITESVSGGNVNRASIAMVSSRVRPMIDRSMRMFRQAGPSAEDAVLRLLKHPHSYVRQEACKVLGDIGTQRSISTLGRLAVGRRGPNTQDAVTALRKIRDRRKQERMRER